MSANWSAPKLVLAWNSIYKKSLGVGKYGGETFTSCPLTNCFFTNNKTKLKEASAVLFHARELRSIPRYRNPSQLYVFFLLESPNFISASPHQVPFRFNPPPFNVTMTYRRDSDIFMPVQYFYRLPKDTRVTTNLRYPLSTRSKSVAWVVSHCETASRREHYVRELKRYIDVDIYGKCGNVFSHECKPQHLECFTHKLPSQYKYYVAFENNVCKDYVTEKLYRTLSTEIIPVVYGGTDYARDSPPHSVIDIMHYRSPKDLAEYLHALAANETEYLKYFEWKTSYRIHTNVEMRRRGFCKLCDILNNPNFNKTYRQVYNWWSHDACERPFSWKNASWNSGHW